MEEIDKIIIDSLKHLKCELDDIDGLKQFDPDMVVNAVVSCLAAINPELKFSRKLPSSMSAKLNLATSLAQQIKDLGFKGDMGYQTILYCNEVEVRRVLMFLIERLPKDTTHVSQFDQTGYVPCLLKSIEKNLKNSLEQLWLPSPILRRGVREVKNGYIVNCFGYSAPLKAVGYSALVNDEYFPKKLIQSLHGNDLDFSITDSFLTEAVKQSSKSQDVLSFKDEIISNLSNKILSTEHTENISLPQINSEKNQTTMLLSYVDEQKKIYLNLEQVINDQESELISKKTIKREKQEIQKNTIANVKLKTKALAIMNKEENKAKLQKIIETANDRLSELANQWHEVQTPLLNEYKKLKSTLSAKEIKFQKEYDKINGVRSIHRDLVKDIKEKSVLKQHLVEQCKKINESNKSNRSAYTQRILEIVGNIKKQNIEIQKILKDTREVQKDINTLTGQVDRSFTLADELIFYDAKHDDMARKTYKLLAALREECSLILKAVTELGQAEREYRNIGEQVETEKNKELKVKLERVYNDIEEIQKEIKCLLSK